MRVTDPEISDLIVAYDERTLERQAVDRDDVVERLRELGNRRAARIVAALPERDGALDPGAVDAMLIRVHIELQRLHEEFQHGRRVKRWLEPLLAALRALDVPRPIRVVDVGCGLGYVVRWLALRGELGDDVELLGVDYNAGIIAAASELAAAEAIDCRFEVGNAFRLSATDEPVGIYISTGVIHHFRDNQLHDFLAPQARAWAFAHWDIAPSWLAGLGAWLFHATRMREPLARHDGVLSALRAHDDRRLLEAARAATPAMRVAVFDSPNRWLPIFKVLRPVVGFRAELADALLQMLGPAARRLEGLE